MRSDAVIAKYLDPLSSRLSIIVDHYSELPWRSVETQAARVQRDFWKMLDQDARRDLFYIPEEAYTRDERGEELEIGLLKKRTGGSKATLTPLEIAEGRLGYDSNKYRFHFANDLLSALRNEKVLLRDYKSFLSGCALFNEMAQNIALRVARAFDACNAPSYANRVCYPGSLEERITKSKTITRLLRYEHAAGAAPDASLHRDRSCFTIHWLSSHPGLILFDRFEQSIRVNETDPRRILIFPGTKFWGATRGLHGSGTLHGVRDPRRSLGSQQVNEQRFAVVSFVHCALSIDDVAWMDAHIHDLTIDRTRCTL
jgi:hypothetical protein